ncbi:hypothetical protein QWZ08_13705 [Ferruginibacter paludis]|uniref:hypothetical protein n=1 Tax=Ferruginibacter paludis TaxID=1310417 RepID=UPI0025B4AF4C|nr:hypothetical protein [Ferruginibacter paludis]MDN3656695.1 hypothetical protein [Ferruginibacter paludis]
MQLHNVWPCLHVGNKLVLLYMGYAFLNLIPGVIEIFYGDTFFFRQNENTGLECLAGAQIDTIDLGKMYTVYSEISITVSLN